MDVSLLGLSLLGFGAFLVLDSSLLATRAPLRHVVSLLGSGALAIAFFRAQSQGSVFAWPAWTTPVGWLLAGLGVALLVYSVFVEIPLTLARDAARKAPSAPPITLVQTGTYALCRHPGVWWLMVLLGGASLIVKRTGLLRLAVLWIVLDIGLVAIQDRVIFPRRFPGYRHYQQSTPFLLPTPASITNFVRGNRQAGHRPPTTDNRL